MMGVVDNFGQVYKGNRSHLNRNVPDFYIVDGGIVPSSLGVNSSLTISALHLESQKIWYRYQIFQWNQL